ncbi:hypothetical protein SMACR_01281 [Sordaria macrospora]|uniref:WGS project CABT00000000 data, contig 2.4 n=2 Tax=Sordaria macrospora TaxID=5147 RepID=F7VQD2_SORMK|nr:uncharacterized protein SMAC_01281 [Sordaria macrospora k-hell]KAA8633765.1 hypothetical protein SMACR_01281 [Sordaria macrospora]KAH7634361.1 hypothetical protein B0T09DRAFT_3842 [Sordaria sp. MPI-SDFR-AT-0083]WPJ58839.1 hypothetical protein SMAC4_01281 [Sordaria macrospora]CCC07714.1 unnamed protein product [Sordaria macrospora k-hell]
MNQQIPLNYEASAGNTNMRITSSLPPEVVQCLENARFLHLATCVDNMPHVSLMNYTYLPSSPYSDGSPVIVMTTNPASKKMNNLVANPNVSLLVHDWVSHRPSTSHQRRPSGGSPGPEHRSSSLAALLFNLNTSAVSSISATINGSARLVDRGSEEEKFYREKHLENNTFDSEQPLMNSIRRGSTSGQQQQIPSALQTGGEEGDYGRERYVADEDVRVVVVGIRDVRIADWKGTVQDWVIAPPEGRSEGTNEALVNGIR